MGSRRREGSWLPEPTQSQKSPARMSSHPPLSLIHLSAHFGDPRHGHQISDVTARPSRLLQAPAASLQAPAGSCRRPQAAACLTPGARGLCLLIPRVPATFPSSTRACRQPPIGQKLPRLAAAWKQPGSLVAWRQVRAVSRSLCCFLVSHPGLFTWSRLVGHF